MTNSPRGDEAIVGSIEGIHRYPVKSMAGEDIDAGVLTARGLAGDRAYALLDTETGRVASGKRPKRWAGIMDFRARYEEPVAEDGPLPGITITDPAGRVLPGPGPELGEALEQHFGRSVELLGRAPDGASFEYHWPDMAGLVYQGREYRDQITKHELLPGTFFDSASLHLLTTSSLAALRELISSSDFEARRFRPNLVIQTGGEANGFVENDWVGRTLAIGSAARVEITKPCLRCVMVTLAQNGLPKDPRILRAAFDHNEGNVGVSGRVIEPGPIRVGDPISLV